MIDLHCHVLPGIDDGPRTIEECLALGRAAEACGTSVIVATPHVNATYPNDAATIRRLVGEVNERYATAGIDVTVLPGAEIAITRFVDIEPEELPRLQLGGSGWLLVEPPFSSAGVGLDSMLLAVLRQGHQIVLAHPERCAAFRRDPRMLESLVAQGVLLSVTAGSLVGRFGEEVRRFAMRLASAGLIHNVASDAHDPLRRPPGMFAELTEAGLAPLAQWLIEGVPSAIVEGREVPAPPPFALDPPREERRSWWRRS